MTTHGVTSKGLKHLTRIGGIANRRRELESEMRQDIISARAEGASWAMIAAALGVTTQSAWERYRPVTPKTLTAGQDLLDLGLGESPEET